ncbi:hypothetical protein FGO68_gene4032 [Halteria grandinella]|uniref:USP domain-containing protein n=1 Tax=Halteria grandinella TaxID=5974 RepID=A0A8J8NHC3_HALGN|nr:hypothetical protein FGO68_gene4032 [Halteria grandinella]
MHTDFVRLVHQPSTLLETPTPNQVKRIDIDACIMNFARPELLDGTNKWYCEQCHQKTEAVKYTYLSREPEHLIIHLRRFKMDNTQRTKLTHIVKFPLGKFNFTKVFHQGSGLRNYERGNKYQLQSVVQHQGNGDGGHYVTYCKDQGVKEWYQYDDSRVSKVHKDRKKEEIVNSNSYLLIYRRRDKKL